jgi:hypothetical protein
MMGFLVVRTCDNLTYTVDFGRTRISSAMFQLEIYCQRSLSGISPDTSTVPITCPRHAIAHVPECKAHSLVLRDSLVTADRLAHKGLDR